MKKAVLFSVLALVLFSLAGCARKVNKEWVPTGGSRADATIELSFEYNPQLEIPVLNDQQGLDLAIARCKSWGYHSAEAFGGHKGTCNLMMAAGFGVSCHREIVTKQYQCLGRGSETTTKR